MKDWQYVMIALGVFLWIVAVFLMVDGSILGERTTGIATLFGLMGMFVILITYGNALMSRKAKKSTRGSLICRSLSSVLRQESLKAQLS